MFPSHVPSTTYPAPPRPALGVRGARRVGVRLRTFWKAPELDEALATGADPLASDELLLRAQQLAEPKKRVGFARSIEDIVRNARLVDPQPLSSSVTENRPLLLELAERLRGNGPHSLRGLAMADLLIHHDSSVLFTARSTSKLRDQITTVLAALEP